MDILYVYYMGAKKLDFWPFLFLVNDVLYMKTFSILLSRFRKHLRKSLLPKFLLFQRKHDESQDLQINTLNIYQIAYDRWGIDSWMDIVSIILDEAINWWLYFFLRALSEDM